MVRYKNVESPCRAPETNMTNTRLYTNCIKELIKNFKNRVRAFRTKGNTPMRGGLYACTRGPQEDVICNIKDVSREPQAHDILKQRKSNERKLPPAPNPGHDPAGHGSAFPRSVCPLCS